MICYEWGPLVWLLNIDGQTWAAWAQVVGTLGALWVAIRVPIWHAKKAEQKATIAQVQLFLALVTEVTSRFDQIFEKLDRNPKDECQNISWFNLEDMQNLADRCHGIDFTMLRDYRLLPLINRFPDQVKSVLMVLHDLITFGVGADVAALNAKIVTAKFNYEHVTTTVSGLKTLLQEYQQATRRWWPRVGERL